MPSGLKTFVLEYRPGSGGRGVAKKRLKLGRYGATTPDEARSAAKRALGKVALGLDPAGEERDRRQALDVSSLIDDFMCQHVEAKRKPGTVIAHRAALDRLRKAHGSLKATSLTRSQVAAIHNRMSPAPYAANRFLAVVSKLFSWASARSLVPDNHPNPATRIERYREASRQRFLEIGELARLGDALMQAETIGLQWETDETKANAKHAPKAESRVRLIDPFAIAAIRLLILTGARLREILHAEWRSVDFERGLLNLPDSKVGGRPIFLSAPAMAVLSALPRIDGNPYIVAGKGKRRSSEDKGLEVAPRADLKKPWAAITKAADLSGLRIHDLRHSYASVGAGASLGLPIIGRLLGHTQPSTTQRYSHLANDPVRQASERIGAEIAARLGIASKSQGAKTSMTSVEKTDFIIETIS